MESRDQPDSNPAAIPARAAEPPAPYIGGKRNLAERLVMRIEAVEHDTYAEPFVGMGGVFLRRRARARVEVVNDRSRDVATFFRVLQRHYVAFMDMLKWQLTSRADFERLMATAPDTLTDLERAARFIYLQRTAYGGKVAGRNFGVSPGVPGRFNVTKLAPLLDELHDRLSGVVIECLDFGEFIARYDRESALFYVDPPYWGSEHDYGKDLFKRSDFERLGRALTDAKGSFILSLNDVPEVRRIFAGFDIERVETTYSIAGATSSQQTVAEVIVSRVRVRRAPELGL